MDIKDLELKKEMTAEEQAGVHGGAVFSLVGSFQNANATGIGNTAANVGPTVTNVDAARCPPRAASRAAITTASSSPTTT